MYYEPPFFLIVFGLFAGLTCGLAFEAALKEQVQSWSKSRSSRNLEQMKGFRLLVPFLGICCGVCIFLAAGLAVFILNMKIALALALPITVASGWLIWSQLIKMMALLERGGSRAIDLDVM
jgi:hypothetical protein